MFCYCEILFIQTPQNVYCRMRNESEAASEINSKQKRFQVCRELI